MADKKLSDVTSVEDFDYFLGVKSNGDVQKMSKDSMKKVISELMSSFLQISSPKNFIVSNPSDMETGIISIGDASREISKSEKLNEPSEDIPFIRGIDSNGNPIYIGKEQFSSVLAELVGVVLFSFEINFSNSENGGGTIDDRYTYKFPGVEFSISDYTTSRFKVNHNIASRKYSISITKLNQAFNGQGGEPTAEVYYAENSESSFYITSGEGKNPANILVTVFGIK